MMKRFINFVHAICDAEQQVPAWAERLAQGFYWLASGTDCRCCLGMRIAVAAVSGLIVGLLL